MIDSTNLMLVAIPTSGLQAPTAENLGAKHIVAPKGEGFAPIKGQTIVTENGYVVHIPIMIGSSTHVTKLGGGYYLVKSKPTVYGAKATTKILTEEELVKKYHGTKIPLMPKDDDKSAEARLQRTILHLLTTEPKVCYLG